MCWYAFHTAGVIDNKSNSTESAEQVEANLQEQISIYLFFWQEMATETLTYGEM